jgi:hypothetical protein
MAVTTDITRQRQQRTPELSTETIDAVLQHIARYRLTVFAVLEQLPELGDFGPRHVRYALRACERQGYVCSATLHGGAKYWCLDRRGAEHCGLGDDRIGHFSEPAKLRAAALLRFCCLSDRPRHLLLPSDIEHSFPSLYRDGMPSGYYFDPKGPGRLGLARVDLGRRGRWDRVIQSLRQDITQHWHRPGFRDFIQAGRFELTVLTVFRQKAQRLQTALSKLRDAQRLPMRVVAIPELLPLVASIH